MIFNRSYNHKDVLVRTSITIQIIDDIALYKAQLYSSNGNIFSQRDENTELSIRVFKGVNDITAKFDDIEWKRFSSNSNNNEEDLLWGEQHKGKTNILITKEDINEKANIQCEVYGLIDNERTLIAADFITFIDINDLQGSIIPPENPKHGDLWLDISISPPRLMMWDSTLGQWIEITIAGKDRRNLIRHSNFYKKNFESWNPVNNPILEIESMSGKKWARIKTISSNNDYCGISQIVDANAKGQYSFQMLSEIYIQSSSPNGNSVVSFYSINESNKETLIKEQVYDINENVKIYTSTFSTLSDTKKIKVIISGQVDTTFDFVVTNIKLENHPEPTAWELALEDIQDALDQKVGNTAEEVFDSLTDGGKMQGIYIDIDEHGNKNYYIAGRYIDAKNLVVRRQSDNVKTLEIDEQGNVYLNVSSLTIKGNDVLTSKDSVYVIDVLSTNGTVFINNQIQTTLYVVVYRDGVDVTSELDNTLFCWKRFSSNLEEDIIWNNTNGKHKKEINITKQDIIKKAIFECEFNYE